MSRPRWTSLLSALGLLLLLAAVLPVAHHDLDHGNDACPLCHFAQHGALELTSAPAVAAPATSYTLVAPGDAPPTPSAGVTPRSTRGPPTFSR